MCGRDLPAHSDQGLARQGLIYICRRKGGHLPGEGLFDRANGTRARGVDARAS